jgi:hypothetical protein
MILLFGIMYFPIEGVTGLTREGALFFSSLALLKILSL